MVLALALTAVFAIDQRRDLDAARADRTRLQALDALTELRATLVADGVGSTVSNRSLALAAERVVALDLDGLLARPAPATSVLEALAEIESGGVTARDAASGRVVALLGEVAATAPAEDGRADRVVALSEVEALGARLAGGESRTDRTETRGRLRQAVARLEAELPPSDARRLDEITAPLLGGPSADAATSTRAVDELRALRRDHAAAVVAAGEAAVADAEQGQRLVAAGAVLVLVLTVLAIGSAATGVAGGIGRIEARVRRLAAGDLDGQSETLLPAHDLVDLDALLDDVTDDLRSVDRAARRRSRSDDVPTSPGPLAARLLEPLRAAEARAEGFEAAAAFAHGLIDATDEAIFTVGERSQVLWANTAAAQLFGMPVEQLVGAHTVELVARLPLLADLPVGITNADSTVITTGGAERAVLVSSRLLGDDDHPTVAVFARDISERRELEHRLSHQATHDDLTGLGNRASLVAELDRARARAQRSGQGFGLLFIDLDRFKAVNDTLGHRTGDLVLREIAARLRDATRDSDFVARNGGDEFVVIAEEATDIATVVRLAERIQDSLAAPLLIEDDSIPVSASIGVTWLDPEDDNSLDQLRNADVAMYQAKSAGPGQVRVFDEDMRNWVEQRFDLERALRKAVGRGELEAFVQPIIDLRTGRVTSGELLCRWTLEDGREIPPDAFIEVAEDSTLVVEIGRWVLDRAGTLLAEWEQSARLGRLGLSVNLSGRHIDHPNVVGDVADALRRTGADPRRLGIEITETSLLRDLQEAAATLRELHDLGVSISVDDFGVGYASLRYLRELPVELVKIDRSIVAGFERVDSDTVIVTMLSRLADVLDISIVAEGVETEEQRERLTDIGCNYAQGFLFAPAMAVPEFERWFAHWERQHTHPARWHELLAE